jgi:hypothetical protein
MVKTVKKSSKKVKFSKKKITYLIKKIPSNLWYNKYELKNIRDYLTDKVDDIIEEHDSTISGKTALRILIDSEINAE